VERILTVNPQSQRYKCLSLLTSFFLRRVYQRMTPTTRVPCHVFCAAWQVRFVCVIQDTSQVASANFFDGVDRHRGHRDIKILAALFAKGKVLTSTITDCISHTDDRNVASDPRVIIASNYARMKRMAEEKRRRIQSNKKNSTAILAED